MNARRQLAMLAAALLGATAVSAQLEESSTPHPRIAEGRAISQELGGELKAALERAIGAKGPASAIDVCRVEAPRIAARLSEEHGVTVSRTALKVRNRGNAPRPWQRAGLESFQKRLADGTRPEALEFFETHPDGSARYLKAISQRPFARSAMAKSSHRTFSAP